MNPTVMMFTSQRIGLSRLVVVTRTREWVERQTRVMEKTCKLVPEI
jgi:hypothetical protein